MRILVISTNYAPERGGIGIYSAGLAEGLVQRGFIVNVVAGFPHYPEWQVRGRSLACNQDINGVCVRRRFHYVPRNPSLARRALFEASLVPSHLLALPRERPDLVVGVIPTLAGGVVAALASRVYRTPYGVVLQDLMTQAARQVGVRGRRSPGATVAAVEGHVVRGAAGVAIVAEGFAQPLERLGVESRRVHRVWNWGAYTAPSTDRATTRRRLGWRNGEIVCLYAGSMGYKHALETLVDAAAILKSSSARIVLAGDGSERQHLERRASDIGAAIEFLPPTPPGEYEAMLEAADLLLLSQRGGVSDMSIASKVRSYRRAGVPILAALPAESETRREFETAGGGIVVAPESAEEVAEAIKAYVSGARLAIPTTETAAVSKAKAGRDRDDAVSAYVDFLEACAMTRPGR